MSCVYSITPLKNAVVKKSKYSGYSNATIVKGWHVPIKTEREDETMLVGLNCQKTYLLKYFVVGFI